MKADIARFIVEGGHFEAEALSLYRWQRAHNLAYDRFCGAAVVDAWWQIPAVPTTLFRDVAFCSFPIDAASACFRTSFRVYFRASRPWRSQVHG